MTELKDRADQALKLANEIELTLRRADPAVRGAALAQALARWVVDHQGEKGIQDRMLDQHVELVRVMMQTLLNVAQRH